jgi:hypothetical protein
MLDRFVELETTYVHSNGHFEPHPKSRWWKRREQWVTDPKTVKITGKVLIKLSSVVSVSRTELNACVTLATENLHYISLESYEILRKLLVL